MKRKTVLQHSEENLAAVKGEKRMDEYTEVVESIQLVDTQTLQKLLGCCYNTAVRIGKAAGARIQIGSAVRWRVSRISRYLDSMSEENNKTEENK